MSKKMTRRDLAVAMGSVAGIASAQAQQPAASQPGDLTAAAKEQLENNSKAISKLDLSLSTEPAFQFKA
jgi:predicted methyltransferase